MAVQVLEARNRGDCRPLVCDVTDADSEEAIDCSSYVCRVAVKTAPSEGATSGDYVIAPTAATGGDGTITIDLSEANWLLLSAGGRYLFEVEARTPGLTGKPVIKEQFILPINGRVIVGAP